MCGNVCVCVCVCVCVITKVTVCVCVHMIPCERVPAHVSVGAWPCVDVIAWERACHRATAFVLVSPSCTYPWARGVRGVRAHVHGR